MFANKKQPRILREKGLTLEVQWELCEKERARDKARFEGKFDESDLSSVPPARRAKRAGTSTIERQDTPSILTRKSVSI